MAASTDAPAEGNVGAGTGATLGKLFGIGRAMKGGIGSASLRAGGFTVGALVAVNAMGDVIDPASGLPIAGARSPDGRTLHGTMRAWKAGDIPPPLQPGSATTLGVVATDAVLTKAQANKVAQMAHDGLARCINPIHTMADGDTIFALATGSQRPDRTHDAAGRARRRSDHPGRAACRACRPRPARPACGRRPLNQGRPPMNRFRTHPPRPAARRRRDPRRMRERAQARRDAAHRLRARQR